MANHTESVGSMKYLSTGADFMTNVVGKMSHYVKGDMEVYGEKEHKLTSLKGVRLTVREKWNITQKKKFRTIVARNLKITKNEH
jgi:hypothetical protein